MKKLIEGVLSYRRRALPALEARFEELAKGQQPHTLVLSCADSRLIPALIFDARPGELFEHRTVGNVFPPAVDEGAVSTGDYSEPAALEYAVHVLNVNNIIICGHSDCGAMKAVASGAVPPGLPNLVEWLKHAAHVTVEQHDESLAQHDALSRANVLSQIEHMRSYAFVREHEQQGKLHLHAWWFDVGTGDVHVFEPDFSRWVLLDETEAARILARL